MRGFNAEMALEFAKDKVWEGSLKVLENQIYIFGKQSHKLVRLRNKVDVIITDSPLLLSILYDSEENQAFRSMVKYEYEKYDNINIFINRNKDYNPKGRTQSLEGAIDLDNQLKNILIEQGIGLIDVKYDVDNINEVLHEITEIIMDKLGDEKMVEVVEEVETISEVVELETKTKTKGNVIVQDIKIGDIQYEYAMGMGIKSEVITLPVRDASGYWTWKNKVKSSGVIINYGVREGHSHYAPNLYNCEAYTVKQLVE
jgi:hypothetical protein